MNKTNIADKVKNVVYNAKTKLVVGSAIASGIISGIAGYNMGQNDMKEQALELSLQNRRQAFEHVQSTKKEAFNAMYQFNPADSSWTFLGRPMYDHSQDVHVAEKKHELAREMYEDASRTHQFMQDLKLFYCLNLFE